MGSARVILSGNEARPEGGQVTRPVVPHRGQGATEVGRQRGVRNSPGFLEERADRVPATKCSSHTCFLPHLKPGDVLPRQLGDSDGSPRKEAPRSLERLAQAGNRDGSPLVWSGGPGEMGGLPFDGIPSYPSSLCVSTEAPCGLAGLGHKGRCHRREGKGKWASSGEARVPVWIGKSKLGNASTHPAAEAYASALKVGMTTLSICGDKPL